MFGPVLNLQKWVEENRALLVPPVANRLVFREQGFFVMVVGGPNVRSDFHYNEGAELFYQLEGELRLHTMHEGKRETMVLGSGDIFLLPPRVPHSPQRSAGSIGLVVERARLETEKDGLLWFCNECSHLLYEEYFALRNIEQDFPPVFDRFYKSEHPICKQCGHKAEIPEVKPNAHDRYSHPHPT